MKAMVLAAGLGTRMAPLARACAKPALPVLDVPVILGLVRQLAAGGVERAIVNAHAHPESLRDALRHSPLPIDWVLERGAPRQRRRDSRRARAARGRRSHSSS